MILERAKFEEWINTYQPNDSVGLPCTTGSCPIATYLNETNETPHTYFRVMGNSIIRLPTGYSNTTPEQHFKMPEWAATFIRQVDDLWEFERDITAARAMSILNLIR